MLNFMMSEQVFNQIGSELTALICDQLSWIPELVEYGFSQKLIYFFLCSFFDFFLAWGAGPAPMPAAEAVSAMARAGVWTGVLGEEERPEC